MKRKSLVLAAAVCLMSVLCYGCGDTASTQVSLPEESAPADEAEVPEEAGQAEKETQEDAQEEAKAQEEAEPEVETETVYLLSKSTTSDVDGNVTYSEENTYDESGRKSSSVTFSSWSGETEKLIYKYEFFENGALKKETGLKEDGSIDYENEFEYDVDGNMIYGRYTNPYGIFEYKRTYENGVEKTASRTEFDDAGKITYVYNYVYNEFGDTVQVETIEYGEDGSELNRDSTEYTLEYNGDNLLIKRTDTDDDTTTVQTYDYDSQGNVILDIRESHTERDDGSSGFGWHKATYTYDEHNNQTNQTGYDPDGGIASSMDTEYTYDSAFNIIKRVDTDENGEIVSVYEAEYISMELPKTE